MAVAPIVFTKPDPKRLAVLRECTENYSVGDPEAEWPNNLLSGRTVVTGGGAIRRAGDPIRHAVDPDELALCRRLAAEAASVMAGVPVGMGSESGDGFGDFFVVGDFGEPVPAVIDEALIRSRFGGTIFPLATVTAEPLTEAGVWWAEVEQDGASSGDDYLVPWRAMVGWFREQPEFVATAFVRIGDGAALGRTPRKKWPAGTETPGCVLPRLAVGLTRAGSLVGLFGHSVQT